MRAHLLGGIAIICVAQTLLGAAQKSESRKAPPKPITLSGCVQRGESAPDQYTLSESKGSQIYRLTGTDLRDYVGRRVQLTGGVPARLRIAGGLTPSANAAAQAGAMDPARAATAAASGSAGPGTVELPEFRVKSVRPVDGSCSN